MLVSTVNYSNGYRPDVARISQLAHAAGALLYVDGTQSVGALTFDVREVKPDMLAVDGYKWLLCPNGATFFYVSPELRPKLRPSVIGWRSDRGWRSVDELHHGAPNMPEAAEKYEGGMLNFASLYGMQESVRMMLEIGPDRVEHRVLELAGLTADILRRSGATIVNENTNVVAAHWPDRDASALARSLQARTNHRSRKTRKSASLAALLQHRRRPGEPEEAAVAGCLRTASVTAIHVSSEP